MIRSLRRRSPDAIHLAAVILLCKQVRSGLDRGEQEGRATAPNPTAAWSAGWSVGRDHLYITFVPPVKVIERRIEREIVDHILRSFRLSLRQIETRDSGGNLAIRCWLPLHEEAE